MSHNSPNINSELAMCDACRSTVNSNKFKLYNMS